MTPDPAEWGEEEVVGIDSELLDLRARAADWLNNRLDDADEEVFYDHIDLRSYDGELISIELDPTSAADTPTTACVRLIGAVIIQAINDALHQLTDAELNYPHKCGARFRHRQEAIAWLFDEGTMFEQYAELIGVSPKKIREALWSYRTLLKVKATFWEERP